MGLGQGPGEPGGRRRALGGCEGRGRLRERDLGWSRYPEECSFPLLPGPASLDHWGEGRGPPPSVRGQICWGKGKGRAVTDGVRRGSGANRSLAVGPRELGAVAFTAGMCVRVVAVVLL